MAKKGTFSSENQPANKRGKSRYSKLIDALEAKGYTEKMLYEKIVMSAMNDGDVTMLKEIMTRFCPPSKPSAQEIIFEFPESGTPVEKIDSVIIGVSTGDIPADIGKLVVDMIKTSLDVEETTELAQRLEKLETMISQMAKN
jgi:hypothetical protein